MQASRWGVGHCRRLHWEDVEATRQGGRGECAANCPHPPSPHGKEGIGLDATPLGERSQPCEMAQEPRQGGSDAAQDLIPPPSPPPWRRKEGHCPTSGWTKPVSLGNDASQYNQSNFESLYGVSGEPEIGLAKVASFFTAPILAKTLGVRGAPMHIRLRRSKSLFFSFFFHCHHLF